MKRVKDDFDKRKAELNDYFDFLSKIDKDKPTLHYSEIGVRQTKNYTYAVDTELQKILRANGFLLIYNLIESFCRNSLLEILLSIEDEKVCLKDLSEQAQQMWIIHNVRESKEDNSRKQFYKLAKDIIEDSTVKFKSITDKMTDPEKQESDIFGLSGNIDARKIRKLAEIYGFKSKLTNLKEIAGNDLLKIKEQRNQLAHGHITFADCGKDKSVTEMINYKNNAIEYLEGILDNIEDYINNTKFKK